MSRPRFAPGSTVVFPVRNRSGKQPLLTYLAARLGVVEGWVKELLTGGYVSLDDEPAGADTIINLSAGPHRIAVTFPRNWPRHMAATEMPLAVLHEDDHLLFLDKPAGTVVHPARGHLDNRTLQNGVRHRYRHLLGREDITLGPPHRLDKDTSGVVLFAITRRAYVDLVAQFSTALPHKEYFAVLDGTPGWTEFSCSFPIGPDPERKGLGTILPTGEGGKTARTDFRILERGDGWALALATPHTGRPHQIRVHAVSLGLPLAGDRDYNPHPERLGFARQALHAAALTVSHPFSRQPLRVQAPLAADLAAGLDSLRRSGSGVESRST